jgi:3-hydroxyisobutyrate dehydrogenase
MTTTQLPAVAFLGLGAMGAAMATRLAAAGYPLRVWNRSRPRAQAFADAQAAGLVTVCASPADAARGAAWVVSMVADDDATRAVMLGADGVIPTAAPGTVIIDASTNTPAMARTVAEAGQARGVHYLDAPVSGSVPQAKAGELVFMVGGEAAALTTATPVLEKMGRTIRHVGPSGSGATIKLVNNMLSGTVSAAIAETVAVAEAAGLDPAIVHELLSEGAAGSRLTRSKIPKMTGRDFAPQFQLALMEKDLRYFLALAEQLDRPAPIASLVRSQYQAARRADLGNLDVAALYLQVTGGRRPDSA